MSTNKSLINNICLSGLFIALGIVFPFLTGQIPEIGNMLSPMHIPVLICGIVCGFKYGLFVGFITPILRSLIFHMPPMYPTAISMAFELATYGFISGLLFKIFNKQVFEKKYLLYVVLIISMLCGRIIWGITRFSLALLDNSLVFTFKMFLAGAFIQAWPGIILHLVLVPLIIFTLMKTNLLKENNNNI